MTQTQIDNGNARIKEWLYRFAPTMHSNYTRFKIPFEFHNSMGKQYAVHAQFAPEFKHLQAYRKFDVAETDEKRFECLLQLVNIYYHMKRVKEILEETKAIAS